MIHKFINPLIALPHHRQIRRTRQFILLLFIVAVAQLLTISIATADSPDNIVTDIEWDEDSILPGNQKTLTSVAAIQAAFAHAHREEEIQLGLPTGTIGDITLPADWLQLTMAQKAVILINAERRARANGTVLGLPLAGIDSRLTTIAQAYADHLLATNTIGHFQDGSPTDRINAVFGDPKSEPTVACQEFLPRAEGIAAFWSTREGAIPAIVEQAIYGWLYRDSSSNWGHRETILLQDRTIDGVDKGYHNDAGSSVHEGFLGIGHAAGAGYDPLDAGWPKWGEIIILNIIDPSTNPNCATTADQNALTVNKVSTLPGSVTAGSLLTVTYTMTNNGSTLLTGLNLTDIFDLKNLQFVSASPTPHVVDTNTGTIAWETIERGASDNALAPAEVVKITLTLQQLSATLPDRNLSEPAVVAQDGWQNIILGIREEGIEESRQWLYLPVVMH